MSGVAWQRMRRGLSPWRLEARPIDAQTAELARKLPRAKPHIVCSSWMRSS
jgi:hypothetical protein